MSVSAKVRHTKQEQILKSSIKLLSFYEYDNLYAIPLQWERERESETHFTLCLPTQDVFSWVVALTGLRCTLHFKAAMNWSEVKWNEMNMIWRTHNARPLHTSQDMIDFIVVGIYVGNCNLYAVRSHFSVAWRITVCSWHFCGKKYHLIIVVRCVWKKRRIVFQIIRTKWLHDRREDAIKLIYFAEIFPTQFI